MVEIIGLRQPLDQLVKGISEKIGVDPTIIVDSGIYGRLWEDQMSTSLGLVRAGTRLTVSPERLFKEVLGLRVFGEIHTPDWERGWCRLYLAESLDSKRIRDGMIPRGLGGRLSQAVSRAWIDTHGAKLLEVIARGLQEEHREFVSEGYS